MPHQERRGAYRGLLDCVCSNTAYCNLQIPQVHLGEDNSFSENTERTDICPLYLWFKKNEHSLKTSSACLPKDKLEAEPESTEAAVFIRPREEECVGLAPGPFSQNSELRGRRRLLSGEAWNKCRMTFPALCLSVFLLELKCSQRLMF